MSRPAAIKPISQTKGKVRILVYGEPGTKKSILAATSPRVLILANNEEEMIAPAQMGLEGDVWEVQDWDDLIEAKSYLLNTPQKEHGYEWVWFDNMSQFEGQGMKQIMEQLVAKNSHRSLYIPDMAEYQVNMRMMEEIIRDLCGLPMHLGLTAQTMRIYNPDTDEMQKIPLVGTKKGDNSEKIAGMMNIVAYVKNRDKKEGEGSEVVMRVRGTKDIMAKDRFGAIAPKTGIMIDPTIPRIMSKINGQAAPAPARRPAKKIATKRSPATKKVT